MNNYIINDSKKIIFLKNYEILFEYRGARREKINKEYYELLQQLCEKYTYFKKDDLPKKLFLMFKKYNLIIKAPEYLIKSYNTKLERTQLFAHDFFHGKDFTSLEKKNVLFIGLGGIASEIINHLLAVGIIKYSIVDFDYVEISNLNRQFIYKKQDIGKSKTDVFSDYILQRNEKAIVKKYNYKILHKEQINSIVENDKIDVVILSADIPLYYLQKKIIESSIDTKVPCIMGGVGINEGSYGPFLFSNKMKKKFLTKVNSVLDNIEGIYPCKGSLSVTNSLIATYMAWDIIMFLMDEKKRVRSLNKIISINFKD